MTEDEFNKELIILENKRDDAIYWQDDKHINVIDDQISKLLLKWNLEKINLNKK